MAEEPAMADETEPPAEDDAPDNAEPEPAGEPAEAEAVAEAEPASLPAEEEKPERPDTGARGGKAARGGGKASLIGLTMAWLVLLALLGAGGAYAWFERAKVVALWPPAEEIYALLHLPLKAEEKETLLVRGVTAQYVRAGGPVRVRGEVYNEGEAPRARPRLRISLLDARGRELVFWHVRLKQTVAPGGSVEFSTQFAAPPQGVARAAARVAETPETAAPSAHESAEKEKAPSAHE